jgi:hypothetical protein
MREIIEIGRTGFRRKVSLEQCLYQSRLLMRKQALPSGKLGGPSTCIVGAGRRGTAEQDFYIFRVLKLMLFLMFLRHGRDISIRSRKTSS